VDWDDGLKLALSIFLIITGLGLAYLFLRMAEVFQRLGRSLVRLTDELVPVLNKTQTTVDGVNLELARTDEIMKSAVGATKGAEKSVQTVSTAVTAPVRKVTGLAAGAREAVATLKARRAAEAADRAAAPPPPAMAVPEAPPPPEPAMSAAPAPAGAAAGAEAPKARHPSPY
jgi:uncharacterized protein YoxC